MGTNVGRIIERLREAEDELTREADEQQKRWSFRVHRGRVWFDDEVRRAQWAFRQSIPAFLYGDAKATICRGCDVRFGRRGSGSNEELTGPDNGPGTRRQSRSSRMAATRHPPTCFSCDAARDV